MIKNNWYQKYNNQKIQQEAGIKENILYALMVLSIVGFDWKLIDVISNKFNVSKQTIVEKSNINSQEMQQIKEIIENKNRDNRFYEFINSAQQKAKEIQQPLQQPLIVTNKTVDVVRQLEGSNASATSKMGASGIMQIMRPAWEEINIEKHNGKYPYDKFRFNKKINMMFGKEYLEKLAEQLNAVKHEWKADPYFLLFVAYNTGLKHAQECKYDERLILKHHPSAHDYATRGINLLKQKISNVFH